MEPTGRLPLLDRLKPVLAEVQSRLPHTSVNNSTRVPEGLIKKTSRSAGKVWLILTPTTSTPKIRGPFGIESADVVVSKSAIALGTSVLA